jgi:membrane protease YdiL (CAAX protease family)
MEQSKLTLSKLTYTMLSLSILERIAAYSGRLILNQLGHPRFIAYTYPAIAYSVFILLGGISIAYYEQSSSLFRQGRSHFTAKNVFWGLASGVGFLLIAVLLAGRTPAVSLESYAAAGAMLPSAMWPAGILLALVVFVALPILAEVVFRGIAFGTLSSYTTTPAAAIISAVLFYFLWPLFSPAVTILFGLTMPILYHKTKSLVPTIIANCVVTCSGFAFVVIGLYKHG